jgi:hypothetical protein
MVLHRDALLRELSRFLSREAPEDEFCAWLAALQLGDAEIEPTDAALFSLVGNIYEDESLSVEQRITVLAQVAEVLREGMATLVIPYVVFLVARKERFCGVARKHISGVVSRTGWLSFVAESGLSEPWKRKLEAIDVVELAAICDALERGAYPALLALLGSP